MTMSAKAKYPKHIRQPLPDMTYVHFNSTYTQPHRECYDSNFTQTQLITRASRFRPIEYLLCIGPVRDTAVTERVDDIPDPATKFHRVAASGLAPVCQTSLPREMNCMESLELERPSLPGSAVLLQLPSKAASKSVNGIASYAAMELACECSIVWLEDAIPLLPLHPTGARQPHRLLSKPTALLLIGSGSASGTSSSHRTHGLVMYSPVPPEVDPAASQLLHAISVGQVCLHKAEKAQTLLNEWPPCAQPRSLRTAALYAAPGNCVSLLTATCLRCTLNTIG